MLTVAHIGVRENIKAQQLCDQTKKKKKASEQLAFISGMSQIIFVVCLTLIFFFKLKSNSTAHW